MTPFEPLPKRIKQYIAFQAAVIFVAWFGWQFSAFLLGGGTTIILLGVFNILFLLSPRLLGAEEKEFIKIRKASYRRYMFGVFAKVIPVMAALQLALAMYVSTALMWIISGVAIVIGGASLLGDWAEAKEQEAKLPNQSPDPTLASVTPAAVQPPRLP